MLKLNRQGLLFNALMLASLVAVVAGPFHRFKPEWQPAYLVAASFVVAVEAGLVHHAFRREHMWLDELARYLVPEVFVMLIVMRVATTLGIGAATLAARPAERLRRPLCRRNPSWPAGRSDRSLGDARPVRARAARVRDARGHV